ncbi:MAG: heme exporter protein CcmB [Anaerolineae bacterium]|jgi:heme exporter protein B|nr:heme exporter protein CcmB [Anaerolineae bacterium]MDH7472477.1 heme exporter protein CcmB [Anaerolineae bacterium]
MNYLRKVWTIVWKDLLTELRSREMIASMLVFALLVLFIFNFAFELRVEQVTAVAPGVLWVTFIFAGMLGLSRAFVMEKDQGCWDGLLLSPVDRSVLYFGKMLSNVLFMLIVEAIALPAFVVLFNLPFPPLLPVVVFLSTIGFAAVGTLFSAMTVHVRAREVLLPVLLFPVVVPVIIAAVKLTAGLLDGLPLGEMGHWLRLLVAFDIIFLAVACMTFDYVVEE